MTNKILPIESSQTERTLGIKLKDIPSENHLTNINPLNLAQGPSLARSSSRRCKKNIDAIFI